MTNMTSEKWLARQPHQIWTRVFCREEGRRKLGGKGQLTLIEVLKKVHGNLHEELGLERQYFTDDKCCKNLLCTKKNQKLYHKSEKSFEKGTNSNELRSRARAKSFSYHSHFFNMC